MHLDACFGSVKVREGQAFCCHRFPALPAFRVGIAAGPEKAYCRAMAIRIASSGETR
jgi:hypothetical protein